MNGHTWTVEDKTTGLTFTYKRYAPSGAYYMKREGEPSFRRVKREELFKSLRMAHVQLRAKEY